MSIKSLIQRLLGIPAKEMPADPVARLHGRSDWDKPGAITSLVAPWDRVATAAPQGTNKWPATDDPYAAPEPCPIVPDPALEKLAERGLTRPMDSVKSVTDLIQLIERQEMAETILKEWGWYWDAENHNWMHPNVEYHTY